MRRPHVVAAAVMKADFPVVPDTLLQVPLGLYDSLVMGRFMVAVQFFFQQLGKFRLIPGRQQSAQSLYQPFHFIETQCPAPEQDFQDGQRLHALQRAMLIVAQDIGPFLTVPEQHGRTAGFGKDSTDRLHVPFNGPLCRIKFQCQTRLIQPFVFQ